MKSEKIALVTDSTADIPLDLATEYNITIIPTLLIIDGESIEDGSGLSREEFYNSLPDMQPPPTTAAPSSGTFSQAYKHLFSQGYSHLISIHASSLLSGIFNSAKIAASPFGEKIYVIDSKQISTGLGFQVLAGAEAIKRGASIDDILKLITEIRQRIHLIAMLDTLEYVRRSGRVNWVRARLGSMLRIKPFVEVKNGEIISIEQVRTRRIGISRLVEMNLLKLFKKCTFDPQIWWSLGKKPPDFVQIQ